MRGQLHNTQPKAGSDVKRGGKELERSVRMMNDGEG